MATRRTAKKRTTVRKTARRKRARKNPAVMIVGANPGGARTWTRGSLHMSERVYEVRYRHLEMKGPYFHPFARGVCMEGLPDGSVRLFHPTKPIWADM